MIEKIISSRWNFHSVFDDFTKVSEFSPDIYVPDPIKNFIENLQPDPRFSYVHLIAMSDGNSYGPNLNGDVFRADELSGMQSQREADKNLGDLQGVAIPRYRTFEQAKFYRHHANSPFDPAYGDVPLAAWNEPMRRVELIVRICRVNQPDLKLFGAPDILIKLDKRGFITVSMGCRIHHEQCSYCGNENELVSDRCDCLRNHMNEIMPDGRMVTADNFEPRFFDLSDVTVPADPIAYSLQKVASTVKRVLVNFAKDAMVSEDKGSWSKKFSEIDKVIPTGITVNDVPTSAKTTNKTPPDFTEEEMKKAYQLAGNLDTLASTLAIAGIVMSPTELAYFTSLAEPDKIAEQNFNGIKNLSLDKFSFSLYDFMRSKLAERSGFSTICPESGWEPTKLAENGFDVMSDYYAYYRKLLSMIPMEQFVKVAHRNPHVRELLGKSDESYARVQGAMYYLAHAGMMTV